MNNSPQLNGPWRSLREVEAPTDKLRHLIEGALSEAERLQSEIPPSGGSEAASTAYDDLDDIIEWLRNDVLDRLVAVEKSHREWDSQKAAEEYDAPTWAAR